MATEEYSIGYEDGKSAGFDECMAQQRTWVGLTDEEHTNIQRQTPYKPFMTVSEYATLVQVAIEAKLKEKNT